MKLKHILTFILSCIFASFISAQFTVEGFVNEGIALHDNGQYKEAIEAYEKALAIDPNSALVNYEIALSYYVMGDYKKTIKYSDKVLKSDSPHAISAYITKGNALDMMGKTKKSIKVFNEAIAKTEGHYLLNYNLAVNYYKKNDLDNAEIAAMGAVENNLNHASSHLMLAHINNARKNKIQAILASHFFLLLEPNTGRSEEAYNVLMENFNWNVSKDPEKDNTINIFIDPSASKDNEFGSYEMLVSLLAAAQLSQDSIEISQEELYIGLTESVFKMLGEDLDESKEGIWWNLYVDFYNDLVESDHFQTYMYYVLQTFWENADPWLDENQEALEKFSIYLNGEDSEN